VESLKSGSLATDQEFSPHFQERQQHVELQRRVNQIQHFMARFAVRGNHCAREADNSPIMELVREIAAVAIE
jgi:hypothetical protein